MIMAERVKQLKLFDLDPGECQDYRIPRILDLIRDGPK